MISFLKRLFKKQSKKARYQKAIDGAFAEGMITNADAEILEKFLRCGP